MLSTYLLLAFAAVTGINCLFYLVFSRFSFSKHQKSEPNNEPVSVIVYSKNQGDLLNSFLPKLLNQNHPNFEIVVVSNASFDNTIDVLEEYEKEHNNFKIVDVENNEAFWGSKKYALTLGIKKALHKKLLFITPCVSELSENWISETSGLHSNEKEIIVGYNTFKKSKGLFSRIIRFNRLHSAIQNFGIGSYGKPFRASQDNLGFTSGIFYENNGYSVHLNSSHENENLLLDEVLTSKNIAIASTKDSITYNQNINFKDWLQNSKKRLLSFDDYSSSVKFCLRLFFISQFLFWIGALVGGITTLNLIWFILIAVRFFIVGIVIGKTAFKLSDKDLFCLFPFWEIINICLQLVIFISTIFSKPKH